MKILVVGGGGREHALCWSLHRSPLVEEIFCAPGNPGIAEVADCLPVSPGDIVEIADLAETLHVDLTVVGPELPLSLGIADEFVKRGLPIFGPTRLAAQIESSKVFSKEFFRRHNIPTAEASVCQTAEEARKAIKKFGFPVVLKADGLAGGKGVLIIESDEDAERALRLFFQERVFGAAGDRIIVEEFLRGQEVLVPRALRRRGGRSPPDGARLQEGLRRRPRPEHRRHGRALAGRRSERRDRLAGAEGHPLADAARPPGRGALVPRRALRRADAHGVGPEGPRVQRALRRPGDGGHPAARHVRHGRRPDGHGPGEASRASCRSRSRTKPASASCCAPAATRATTSAAGRSRAWPTRRG